MSQWRDAIRAEIAHYCKTKDTQEFELQDFLEFSEPTLREQFPENNTWEASVRRTLQELRDSNELQFLGEGHYRLNELQDKSIEESLTNLSHPQSTLNEKAQYALANYQEAQSDEDWDHPVVSIINSELPDELQTQLTDDSAKNRGIAAEHLNVRGSSGTGRMANIPWIGVFDRRVANGPQDGLYVVYLFNTVENQLHITLNQGMTELKEKYGMALTKDVLSKRAELLRTQLDLDRFELASIDLPEQLLTGRNKYYGSSTICYRSYEVNNFPSESNFIDDLIEIVTNYQQLVTSGFYQSLLDSFDEQNIDQRKPKAMQEEREGRPNRTPKADHPLLTYLDGVDTPVSALKFTAPPDYWLTAIEYKSVSFEEEYRNRWEQLDKGDIAFLHSRAEPSNEELPNQPNGLIGVGIVGEKFEKGEPWWWDEQEVGETFPLIASFDRLFLAGHIDQIDTSHSISEKQTDEINRELGALTKNLLTIQRADEICHEYSGIGFPSMASFGTFRSDDDQIDLERPRALIEAMSHELTEVSPINVHKSYECSLPDDILEGLHFEDELGQKILVQIETALRSGKHVLLTGPPGTGKTEIASRVCRHLIRAHPYLYSDFEITTATADWSTFDTVGGYMPSESADGGENLSFTPGIVLNRLKDGKTGTQANELIVIDELNRADIDKAFGQLFTLLSGQSVQLPYTKEGREIELLTTSNQSDMPDAHQYLVPQSWRIFATMNSYDKTSLYEMSYAFMRRFAFIRVPAPKLPDGTSEEQELTLERIVHSYENAWGLSLDRTVRSAVGHVWRETNHAVEERAIGPAIIEDIVRYVQQHPPADLQYHLTQAVISYIFPQLEGVPKRERIVRRISEVGQIDDELLEEAAREMLQVTLTENE